MTNDDLHRSYRRHALALVGLWLVLAVGYFVTEPASWNAPHRGWEAVLVSGVVDKRAEVDVRAAPFVPHARWEGTATGDLAFLFHMPGARAPRHQDFTIDEWGFRNPPGTVANNREVVVVGNSFAVGSGVADDETLTGHLRGSESIAATNCGGLDLQGFLRDPRWREAAPKWVVYYIDENALQPVVLREDLPPLDLRAFASRQEYETWIRREVAEHERRQQEAAAARAATYDERDLFAWLPGNAAQLRLQEEIAARKTLLAGAFTPVVPYASHALGVPGFYDDKVMHHDRRSGQLFYAETGERYLDEDALLKLVDAAAFTFAQAAQVLQKRGVRLIVLICPNKEAVYHELVPQLRDREPGVVLRSLIAKLKALDVATVDSWKVIDTERAERPERELFLADDTHPTPYLQGLLAREVAEIVRSGR